MALTQVDQGLLSTNAQYTGFKNRIINGAMVIDQRNAGASVTPANNAYTLDRWVVFTTQASKFTLQQNAGSVTTPAGFTKYLGITSSSAYTVGASDYFLLAQNIEGFNTADLAWGTASASPITLSFRVYSSLTGTFGGSLWNYAGSGPSYPFTYTISSANTWTTISVTIVGPTTGSWNTTNGGSFVVGFGLGVGSTNSNTANGTWYSSQYLGATGATSVVGTNGATFYVTGVQLEKGSTATSFDYRPYGTELILCQRYYNMVANYGVNAPDNAPICVATLVPNDIRATYMYPVQMRARPTVVSSSGSSYFRIYNGSNYYANSLALDYGGINGIGLTGSSVSYAGTSGLSGILFAQSSGASFALNAEL
jgi:hypothetical protein